MRIVVHDYQSRPVLPIDSLRRIAVVAGEFAATTDAAFGFAFVDDERMAAAHASYLGTSGPTDVMAFPTDEQPDPDEKRYLGDVMVCTDQAVRQARSLRHPYPFELRVLALHGLLHLLGYDHTRDDGTMRRAEAALRPRCAERFE